ncbi:hypothetical protein ACWEN3_43495, partial [Streptomyces sp. NPDC004561]
MPESVPVRCPACRREHVFAAPVYPCVCGAPTAPRLDPAGAPAVAEHRSWDDEWIAVACAGCGNVAHWPHPELGCPCGTVLRVAVADGPAARPRPAPPGAARQRPAFQPRAIRTARDAVTAAALYLRWLGYQDIRRADQRPPSGVGLAARGLLATVEPTVRPYGPRDVECLWLTAMTESADCLCLCLAGYTDDARVTADALGVPLFV